jgi:hypothetical protein
MTVLVVLFKFPDLILTYFPFALALFLIGLANSFAWVWVIVHELKKTVKSINTKLFNIAFWIPFIYIWSIIGFILFNLFVRKVKSVNQQVEVIVLTILAVLSVCCIIYGLMFVGRLVKITEAGKKLPIKEHIVESVLMLFPPIGLWIIQPRINRIIARQRLINSYT